MKKIWLFAILALLACVFLASYYFLANQPTKPNLKIEFNPSPPWIMRPGQSLKINITIKNDGDASAINVKVNFTLSQGFIIDSESGSNQYCGSFPELRKGETKTITLSLQVSSAVAPGSYPVTLVIYADNAPQLTFSDIINVQLPP
jgi:uncharacterized repeat protein (TIGR01451 family)